MLSGISPVCCFLLWWERLVLGSMPVLSFYRNGGNVPIGHCVIKSLRGIFFDKREVH